ncbi:MAG: CoA transferase [Chloroflexi bacterium]|nr:CoA transferase [Chloroflexota bacterium]
MALKPAYLSIGALQGIRCVELCSAISGPWATRILASAGCQVIKVESGVRPDVMRLGPYKNGKPTGAAFVDFAAMKQDVTLDLHKPQAGELLRRVLTVSDLFIENLRPGTVERYGLDYKTLRRLNPGLVMISMPGVGLEGPERGYVAYGMSLQAYIGLNAVTGYPGGPPANPGFSFPDFVAGLHAAFAAVAALDYRRRTGVAQFIELSQYEAGINVLGPLVEDYVVNGRVPERMGNRHPVAVPHGIYRCLDGPGADLDPNGRWVALAVFTDAQWRAFRRVLGDPAWAEGPRFATLLARQQNEDDLDRLVEAWTVQHTAGAIMERMQAAGVPAGAVQRFSDLLGDPHLKERGYYQTCTYAPYMPLPPYPASPVPVRLSATPCQFGPPPALGEHNAHIFQGLLGMPPQEIHRLAQEGVIA